MRGHAPQIFFLDPPLITGVRDDRKYRGSSDRRPRGGGVWTPLAMGSLEGAVPQKILNFQVKVQDFMRCFYCEKLLMARNLDREGA